ncbi:MAG TPA: YdeI/OmpD-associated family protein [Caulobacteraceae bacterium]|jgi:uncharacterized protein YdeI (YjbR/CyaY-like superfamily)
MRTKAGLPVPEDLACAIDGDFECEAHWARARPSCQKRYAEHVAEAKGPDACARRVDAVLRQMADFHARHAAPAAMRKDAHALD